MGSLICNSLKRKDYIYSLDLLKMLTSYDITPNEKLLSQLEMFRRLIRQTLLDYVSF